MKLFTFSIGLVLSVLLTRSLAQQSSNDPTGPSNAIPPSSRGGGSPSDPGNSGAATTEDEITLHYVTNGVYTSEYGSTDDKKMVVETVPWQGGLSVNEYKQSCTFASSVAKLQAISIPSSLEDALADWHDDGTINFMGAGYFHRTLWNQGFMLFRQVWVDEPGKTQGGLTRSSIWLKAPYGMPYDRTFHFLKFIEAYQVQAGQWQQNAIFGHFSPHQITIPANSDHSDGFLLEADAHIIPSQLVDSHLQFCVIGLAVDKNRDDIITFDGKDQTTTDKPFRFWVNNDQDDVEVDEPVVVNTEDSNDYVISTKRDMEDFCRLELRTTIRPHLLREGKIKLGLRFENIMWGTPAVHVCPNQSAAGNLDYLLNAQAGTEQQDKASDYMISFCGNSDGTIRLTPEYWQARKDEITDPPDGPYNTAACAHLIMEGVSKGEGELSVVVFDENDNEVAVIPGIHMKIMDVRNMYQRAKTDNEAEDIPYPWIDDNPPPQTWSWHPGYWGYIEDPEAEEITAVFVHGWRMTFDAYITWSDTTYKRLWHEGFKGKFYSFRWATYSPTAFTYNPSEYRAWLCGPALANFVNQLPNPGKRSLFAHSMGNVAAGSALRSGMSVQHYALCNAAMAAMAYDPNPALQIPALQLFATPDIDLDASFRATYGLKNKFILPNLPAMYNFYLVDDNALEPWQINNAVYKPDVSKGYDYNVLPVPPSDFFKLEQEIPGTIIKREVTSLPEAMGYVTMSLTKAIGAEPNTRGAITSLERTVDLNNWGLNATHAGFNKEHSAQWKWNYQSTHHFWSVLVEKLELLDE